jgi:hypothetical protein
VINLLSVLRHTSRGRTRGTLNPVDTTGWVTIIRN